MRHFLKRHRLSGSIMLIACLSSGLFVLLFSQVEQQRADAVKAQQAKDFAKLDKAVEARLTAIKAERAKKESAAKVEAEKKKAAEESKANNSTISAGSDSSTNMAHRNPAALNILVNKKHPIIPLTFTPSLLTVNCAGRGATTISKSAVADFQALCQAAAEASVPLDSSSSYRSYQTQVSTYNYWVSVSGKAGADKYSARPGYSEHQTGLSVDFRVPGGAQLSDFTGTKQQRWLANNAWRYGFIQRYTNQNRKETGYDAESWHYRYIGRAAASNYTLTRASSLERYWGMSGGDYN